MKELLLVDRFDQAEALFEPQRVEVLRELAEPRSCTQVGAALGQSAQRVYHHVQRLRDAGLIDRVDERRVHGISEGIYQAVARSYWLSPRLVGPIGGRAAQDQLSLGYLLNLVEDVQTDLVRLEGRRSGDLSTLGVSGEIRLPTGARKAFLDDLRSTLQDLFARHGGSEGEVFRLLVFTWTLDGIETEVLIELAEAGEHTVLTLRQDRMPTLAELMAPPGRRDGRHSMHTFWALALVNLAEHLAARGPALRAGFGADRPREIRAAIAIAAPPERVLASLVEPAQVERWFGWAPEIEPRVGGRISFGLEGEISEFEPGEVLVYGDGAGAVVRWELTGSAGGTHLTVVQSGFGADELDSATQHEAGWLAGLAELRRMHELGADWAPVSTDLPDGSD